MMYFLGHEKELDRAFIVSRDGCLPGVFQVSFRCFSGTFLGVASKCNTSGHGKRCAHVLLTNLYILIHNWNSFTTNDRVIFKAAS
jgi:hypothetical protein